MNQSPRSGPMKTFLRGGQVTLHTLRMFGQVLRFIGLSMVMVMVATAWFGTWSATGAEERHYALKYYEAKAYKTVGVGGDIELNMLTREGVSAAFTIDTILSHPAVIAHEKTFRKKLIYWSTLGSIFGGAGFLIIVTLFIGRGAHLTKTDIKRGAEMTSAGDLRAQISAYNRWRAMKHKELRKRPRYTIAGVPFPIGSEVQHTAISGTIGSGKTQAISALLEEIRSHGDRAVVFDLTGGFIGPFYRPGRDVILNPLDARAPNWTVFGEASTKAGFDAIAAAMIPQGQKADPVWADSARTVFSTAAQLLVGDGKATNEDLVQVLLNTDLASLEPFFAGTPAATIISAETPRMSNSVRMMLSTYLDCLRLLPSTGEAFRISEWIANDNADGTLFLSSRADMHETLKPLLTVWMDTAVRAIMSQQRDPTRRIWFILDEVAALQKLPSIMDGLARGRQFGAAFVLGVQAQSQLRDIYGIDGAQSLSSVCRTKLILAASDADTAKWYADFLGRQEKSRSDENVSFGANTIRDGVNVVRKESIEHLVIPEEIMNLKSLEGYLKMPEGFPMAKVTLPLVIRDDAEPPFEARPDQSLLITRAKAPKNSDAVKPEADPHRKTTKPKKRPNVDDGQGDMFGTEETAAPDTEFETIAKADALEAETMSPTPIGKTRGHGCDTSFPDWDMEV